MCGIVGFITGYDNGFAHNEACAVRDLLFMDAMRGTDATGIMYGDNNRNVQVHKASMPSWAFLGSKEWESSKNDIISRGRWFFGHNRAATRGSKVDHNAHPFRADHIVLMQNGTYVGNHQTLANVEVDSEACAITIAKHDNVEEALKKINAAYAFVWWNHNEKSLNIIRNNERPLYWARTKSDGIFYCSEAEMMLLACARNNVELIDKPTMLLAGSHTKYTFQDNGEPVLESKTLDYEYKPSFFPVAPLGAPIKLVPHGGKSTEHITDVACVESGFMALNPQNRKTVSEEDYNDMKKQILRVDSLFCEAIDYAKVNPRDDLDNEYIIYGVLTSAISCLDDHIISWRAVFNNETEVIDMISSCTWYSVQPTFLRKLKLAGEDYVVVLGRNAVEARTLEVIQ